MNGMKSFSIPFILCISLLAACSTNPHYDPTKAHHTKSGFQNVYYKDTKGFWDFMKWKWEQLFKDLPDPDSYNFEIDKTHHQLLKSNTEKATLTWIGHATFLIQFSGLNILTDPQFSDRASPFTWAGPKRVAPPGLQMEDLPEIDAVIISHNHYDSLDLASVIALAKHNRLRKITFLVPLGMKAWFDNLNLDSIEVIELDWSDSHIVKGVKFTAEPAQHWSKRTLLDTFEQLWASWVIEANENRIFFAGDTGYAKHFKEIGDKYKDFELALIPIGAYEPRWFMKSHHVNPEEAVQIHQDINSQYSVAMHWGTFILTDEPLDEPPVKLSAALKKFQLTDSEFEVFKHGETRFINDLFSPYQ